MDFVGRTCTTRPGVFSKQVPAAHALSYYQSLRAAEYWSLDDEYPSGSNCPDKWSDSSTAYWSVRVNGYEKAWGYAHPPELAESYKLSRDGQQIGVLQLLREGWVLNDCDGHRISEGEKLVEWRRYIVIDGENKKLRLQDGGLELGSIVLTKYEGRDVTAAGLRENDDVAFTIAEGTSCRQ